jgi:hypothetical protein
VKQIARKATDPRDNRPYDPVKITSIDITGMAKPKARPRKPAAAAHRIPPKASTPK